MKERPIIFCGPMVLSLLAGLKTQTRRVIKLPIIDPDFECELTPAELRCDPPGKIKKACPLVHEATHLWVRESFYLPQWRTVWYRADYSDTSSKDPIKWKPAIFMPRAYSRITLEIIEVRVQRLFEIRERDARAEGCSPTRDFECLDGFGPYTTTFAYLWDSINGKKHPWASNPWVWAISFKRV